MPTEMHNPDGETTSGKPFGFERRNDENRNSFGSSRVS
jgi:hypothetical protein